MVEDMETSYNAEYGGGFRAASSFAEYTKPMVRCHRSSAYLAEYACVAV